MDQIKEFSTLPWMRCPSCGKPKSHTKQMKYDAILADKANTYYGNAGNLFDKYLAEGYEESIAEKMADKEARLMADLRFNERIKEELGYTRYCCFNSSMNPVILPLGLSVPLDPEVDIGERMSKLSIAPYVDPITGKKGRAYKAV